MNYPEENVCRWRRYPANGWRAAIEEQKWIFTNPHNDKKFQGDHFDYTYCPYCGKQIRYS